MTHADLKLILESMQREATGDCCKPLVAKSISNSLLVHTIRAMAGRADSETKDAVAQILNAYRDIAQ